MSKRIAAVALAMTLALAACGGGAEPAEPSRVTTTATVETTVTETATVTPAAMATDELTPAEHVFIVNARHDWPNHSDSDATVLALAGVACTGLALDGFDITASSMRDMIPGDPSADQAINFTIMSVMSICPEHDSKLPTG